jgi:dolichol-phosphate mannosyltransferase
MNRPDLSIVIPFYNEEANVQPLLAALRLAVDSLPIQEVEVWLIDDGSRDATAAALAAAQAAWPAVRVHSFPRNSGQAAALWWGFKHARGRWIATLDGDGQNPPSELRQLWSRRHEADMLVGIRAHRDDSRLRRLMSRVANGVRSRLLGDGVTDSGCALKLFRHEVVESFFPMRTLYSFMPACAHAAGFTLQQIPVAHHARTAGVSNYGLRSMAWRPLLDMLALWWLLRRTLPLARMSATTAPSESVGPGSSSGTLIVSSR